MKRWNGSWVIGSLGYWVIGLLRMEDGGWRMEDGGWKMEDGNDPLPSGGRQNLGLGFVEFIPIRFS